MAVDHGSAAQHTVISHRCGPRDADAAADHAVRSDAAIVPDLNLIINLRAVSDYCVIQRAAVNRGIGADLNIVTDRDAAHLRDLDPFPGERRETEAFTADRGTHIDDHTASHVAVVTHLGLREKMRVFADFGLRADIGAFTDPHKRADLRAGTNHRAGIHPGRRIDLSIGRDHRPQINAGLGFRKRPALHRLARPCVPRIGIRRENHGSGEILKLGK